MSIQLSRAWIASGVVVLLAAVHGCRETPTQPVASTPAGSAQRLDLAADIQMFCGDCHVPPDPQSFSKQHWPLEVERGFEFYRVSGRSDLKPPPQEQVTDYYQSLAPEHIDLPEPDQQLNVGPLQFRHASVPFPGGPLRAAVSDLQFTERGLIVSDMKSGDVGNVEFTQQTPTVNLLFNEHHPAHVQLVNWGPDREACLLIAELGSFAPDDHAAGAVVLRSLDTPSRRHVLLDQVGRVSDVTAADFDGDGQQDVAVAEFGWHATGGLHLLLNTSRPDQIDFRQLELDSRHGASHLHAVDLEEDGDTDLVVLHSQEYESVTAYVNDGQANFTQQLLFAAPLPDYGCSSIDVGDVDSDGDVDVVLTNGDSMDSLLLKPHHSVQWLENLGEWEFKHHRLGQLPGVYGAKIGDIDGDGDMDIVACTMTWWDDLPFNTVVWFEQSQSRQFVRHSLDSSVAQHACLELGDFDQDGDQDIAVGEFSRLRPQEAWLSVWWNEGPADALANQAKEERGE